MDEETLRQKVREAKIRTLKLCINGGYGHPSSAFSCAEIVAELYYEVMRFHPDDPDWEGRDRFLMSKNHASVMLYPILNDLGFIPDDEYDGIMSQGSERTYHTNIKFAGMDFTGGALGIGIGMAAGYAMAAKLRRADWLTFCVVGDAECCEGSVWEAAMFAAHNRLRNLVVIVDDNNMGVTDYTENMTDLEPMDARWGAFGFETRRVNGHSIPELREALRDVRTRTDPRPLCVVADTVKGKGASVMENKLFWHGRVPTEADAEAIYRELEEENR